MIHPPVKPDPPHYISVDDVPDEACAWTEDNRWDSDYHGGYNCVVCHWSSECVWCDPDQANIECARNRAVDENARRKSEYQKSLSAYHAQLEYYKSITAEHISTPGLPLLARADLLLQTARTSENDLRDLATELRDELRRCANLVDGG